MTVITSSKDVEALTLTFVAEYDADIERVWQVWADPRKLERWWGPPTWPASFDRYDFEVGGQVRYHMTGPDGEKSRGWWTITAIDAPYRLEFDDGFADENGDPDPAMAPTHAVVTLTATASGTRMTVFSRFADADQLDQMVAMGVVEGMTSALGQIDGVLAAEAG